MSSPKHAWWCAVDEAWHDHLTVAPCHVADDMGGGGRMPGHEACQFKPIYEPTQPLPDATLGVIRAAAEARGVAHRPLAEAVGTIHTHIGAILRGETRPSKLLASRLLVALDLPFEFADTLIAQSADRGRKMRFGDRHGDTQPVGDDPCPIDRARINGMIERAMLAHDPVSSRSRISALLDREGLYAVGILPTMSGTVSSSIVSGRSLDPWSEFDSWDTYPIVVWHTAPNPSDPNADATWWTHLAEFIASIPRHHVISCAHHA